MKRILAVFIFVSGTYASATPKVGNFERFEYTGVTAGRTVTWEVRNDLIAFNPGTQSFTMRQTLIKAGRANDISDSAVSIKDLAAQQMRSAEILNNCGRHGGSLERIQVPAGLFTACRITDRDAHSQETTWNFPGPFSGYVRSFTKSDILNLDQRLIAFQTN